MEENLNPPAEGEENVQQEEVVLTDEKVEEIKQKLRLEQNLPLGIGMSAVAAIVSAILWGLITVLTQYQIGYMAIGVGFIVGFANRYFGKGIDIIFGVIGAAFALVGCVLGNYLSMIGFISQELGMDFFEALTAIPFGEAFSLLIDNSDFYDILFYGIALYMGFGTSLRKIDEEDLKEHM